MGHDCGYVTALKIWTEKLAMRELVLCEHVPAGSAAMSRQ